MPYMPTLGVYWWWMLPYIPYMDPMGYTCAICSSSQTVSHYQRVNSVDPFRMVPMEPVTLQTADMVAVTKPTRTPHSGVMFPFLDCIEKRMDTPKLESTAGQSWRSSLARSSHRFITYMIYLHLFSKISERAPRICGSLGLKCWPWEFADPSRVLSNCSYPRLIVSKSM